MRRNLQAVVCRYSFGFPITALFVAGMIVVTATLVVWKAL